MATGVRMRSMALLRGHAVSNTSDVEDYIGEAKDRLARWGAEDQRQRQLGRYAGETVEQIMRDYQCVPRGSGMRTEPAKPEIVETDVIVTMLSRTPYGERARLALWLFYAVRKIESLPAHDSEGRERAEMVDHVGSRLTQAECALVMKCSRAQFRDYLEHGQAWVAGFLAGRNHVEVA